MLLALCMALLLAQAGGLTVVVSGASGRVGSEVARDLSKRPHVRVVALVRSAEKARAMLPDGVVVLEADYGDRTALDAALARVEAGFRLFLACGNSPQQAELELNVVRAARARGCAFCCKLSTATPALEMRQGPYEAHLRVEAALREESSDARLPHAVLRPNLFMQMLTAPPLGVAAHLAESDRAEHPFADAAISMIDARDVAAVGAAILVGDDPEAQHGSQTYELTGPTAATLAGDLADALRAVRPRPVEVAACDATKFVISAGVPEPAAARLAGFLDVLAECSDVSDRVEAITGRAPRSLADFVRDDARPWLPHS